MPDTALDNFARQYQQSYDSQVRAGAEAARLRLQDAAQQEQQRASQVREALAANQFELNKLTTLSQLRTAGYQHDALDMANQVTRAALPNGQEINRQLETQRLDGLKAKAAYNAILDGSLPLGDAVLKYGTPIETLGKLASDEAQAHASRNQYDKANSVLKKFGLNGTYGIINGKGAFTSVDPTTGHSRIVAVDDPAGFTALATQPDRGQVGPPAALSGPGAPLVLPVPTPEPAYPETAGLRYPTPSVLPDLRAFDTATSTAPYPGDVTVPNGATGYRPFGTSRMLRKTPDDLPVNGF